MAEATSGGDHQQASRIRAELASIWPAVHAEKLGQVADEFDGVHSIERAHHVGSVQAIVPAARLRPYLIDAVQRGMQRTLAGSPRPDPMKRAMPGRTPSAHRIGSPVCHRKSLAGA